MSAMVEWVIRPLGIPIPGSACGRSVPATSKPRKGVMANAEAIRRRVGTYTLKDGPSGDRGLCEALRIAAERRVAWFGNVAVKRAG
jgi:hypothetical protein